MRKLATMLIVSIAILAMTALPAQADSEKPDVYLTFDDGPSADGSTDTILNVLAKYEVTGTFFMTGERVSSNPGMALRTHESGHAIGNHSWNHPYMTKISSSAQIAQWQMTQEAIAQATEGYVPACWRPPYGATNEMVETRAVQAFGLEQIMWTVDTTDFALLNRSEILNLLNTYVKAGSIVLMHDGPSNRFETAAALDTWLSANKDRYDFQIVPGCAPVAPPPPGPFEDVNGNHAFVSEISWLKDSGITKGCGSDGTMFCPESKVTRGEMAAFINRALELSKTDVDFFVDDNNSVFESDINRLATAGITAGCGSDGTLFCPEAKVSRGQMAAFINRALELPKTDIDFFVDDIDSIFEIDINQLAAAGITKGCNPPSNDQFCPGDYVTRAQMAAFLARALG